MQLCADSVSIFKHVIQTGLPRPVSIMDLRQKLQLRPGNAAANNPLVLCMSGDVMPPGDIVGNVECKGTWMLNVVLCCSI